MLEKKVWLTLKNAIFKIQKIRPFIRYSCILETYFISTNAHKLVEIPTLLLTLNEIDVIHVRLILIKMVKDCKKKAPLVSELPHFPEELLYRNNKTI